MPTIVGVKFKSTGKSYFFDPTKIDFCVGDGVIVETARGVEYGIISIANKEVSRKNIVGELKPVKRKATEKDTEHYRKNLEQKASIMQRAKQKIDDHKLDMHLKDIDLTFDNSKIVFYFTAEGRVDFRDLVKDLAAMFHARIELRQIGIRDETKMLGGLGSCGRPCCCNAFLNDFERVSIKMAKNQGLSLNPAKISGLCGRLMCCLKYENAHYAETLKLMPKVGSIVTTPKGKATVESVDLLKRTIKTKLSDVDGIAEVDVYPLEDVKFGKPTAAEQEKNADNDLDTDIPADLSELLD